MTAYEELEQLARGYEHDLAKLGPTWYRPPTAALALQHIVALNTRGMEQDEDRQYLLEATVRLARAVLALCRDRADDAREGG